MKLFPLLSLIGFSLVTYFPSSSDSFVAFLVASWINTTRDELKKRPRKLTPGLIIALQPKARPKMFNCCIKGDFGNSLAEFTHSGTKENHDHHRFI